MKTAVVLAFLSVLQFAVPALATTRSWPTVTTASSPFEVIQMITSSLSSTSQVTSTDNKDPEDKKVYVLVEYKVPPSRQEDFVSAFENTSAETKKEEGSIVYTLSRLVDDNLTFYLYSEWDGMKAYGEHFNSPYLKDFFEAIAGLDVVWKLHFLDPVVY